MRTSITGILQSHFLFVTFTLIALLVLSCISSDEGIKVISFDLEHLDHTDLFFEIVRPKELQYTYKIFLAANFGVPFNTTLMNVGLVPVDPIFGCGAVRNGLEIRDNVALIQRGECSFLSKAFRAELAGALGVIIMDSDYDDDENYVEMVDDKTDRQVSIPTAFLLGKNGHVILRTLKAKQLDKAIINIPLNLTNIPRYKQKQPPWLLW